MQKIIFIIIGLLQLSILGCSHKQIQPDDQVPVTVEATPSPDPTPPTVGPGVGDVVFTPLEYYSTPQERVLILAASKKLNEVRASKCFYDFLATRKMIQTESRTPQEVAEHVTRLMGRIDVRMYYRRFTSAVAYREPPELKINLNTKFFNAYTPTCEWASTIGHEGLGHALGEYGHDYEWSPEREYSVPYSINHAIEKCCKED